MDDKKLELLTQEDNISKTLGKLNSPLNVIQAIQQLYTVTQSGPQGAADVEKSLQLAAMQTVQSGAPDTESLPYTILQALILTGILDSRVMSLYLERNQHLSQQQPLSQTAPIPAEQQPQPNNLPSASIDPAILDQIRHLTPDQIAALPQEYRDAIIQLQQHA
ncbi:hypothetical protein CANCADRAFT_3563 [Tortispora caseinolytica NRRL Y-17796]|uniref:Uncharacterized protein n=1 Tax=Tortispora caseinolytica NRRL Y-17796 TaxID=767744 RepID=A0A1E4TB16_9ASCO|nr:hypothetical protein CANCADRAFT_3563 [Tortispora caseinolytica NRRL Y-17796]